MSRRRSLALLVLVAAAAPSDRLVAQQTAAPGSTGKGEITGVVIDSLRGQYLVGAEVMVEGVEAIAITDSTGRFRLGDLPPGTYQVGVFHPVLDTLGTSLATKPFRLGADSATFLVLAVPSAATIVRDACPAPSADQGHSAVIGHVNDAETNQPIAGAEVSIAWTQIEVSKEFGVRRTPRVVRDTTGTAGVFRICGLPSALDATLQARKGEFSTAEIPVSLGSGESELLARSLLLSATSPEATVGTATVSGRVVLAGSPTNAGSRVELVGTDKVALTNDVGEFTMTNLPSGSRVLLARHLGFAAETVPVDLSPLEPKKVTITLPKFVAIMDPVLVTARRTASLDRVGFSQRKKSGSGYFLGPEQVERIHAYRLTDILRRVPGLRVSSNGMDDVVSSSRGGFISSSRDCVRYYVDDMPWMSASPGDINSFVSGREVVAVEVYQASTAPAQYKRMGSCTVIVLWTRFQVRDLRER